MSVPMPESFWEQSIRCQHITPETFGDGINPDECLMVKTEPDNKGKFLYLCPICAALVRERVLVDYFKQVATEYAKLMQFKKANKIEES